MSEKMMHNFKGRIRNFPMPKSPFISVYEAISNALQAISERNNEKGRIDITIFRQNESLVEGGIYPIRKIVIEDNGIGFNTKNYTSFKTSDSLHKLSIGGKGIGRLNWLKTFEKVNIESAYDEDGELVSKCFSFDLDNEITLYDACEEVEKVSTKISLIGLKREFYKSSAIDVGHIANKIIQHFTSYFVIGLDIDIYLHDADDSIYLNELFALEKYIKSKDEKITVNGNKFELKHVFLKTDSYNTHEVFVCAQNRVVTKIGIPNLDEIPSSFDIDNSKAIYQCFVSGEYLDQDVNQERNEFNSLIFEKSSERDLLGDTYNLYEKVIEKITIYLDHYLEPIKLEKMNSLRDFILKEAPEYTYLYNKKREQLDKISYSTIKSKSKLTVELFRINQRINLENYSAVNNLEHKDLIDDQEVQKIMENITDIAKSELVSYVVRRKLVIQVLRKLLSYNDEDKYYFESRLHNLFFPMKNDDSVIDYNQHNLWLIDERLSYAYRYFSDKELKQAFEDSDSSKRPDGIFLDAVSFTDTTGGYASNVTIIEFKRPGRDDYNSKNNPFEQVYTYIDLMVNKNAKGINGEVINVDENTRFVAYVIADITPILKKEIRKARLQPTANHQTYFGYNEGYKVFIEVIPYAVVLDNSIKRNDVFFKKISV